MQTSSRVTLQQSAERPSIQELQSQLTAERAERARLQGELELHNCALDTASTHFMIVDVSQPEWRIVYVNRSICERHGYTAAELLGRSPALLVCSEKSAAALARVGEVADVAKLVGSDSALAARVLQIVNSAFFRLARRISNIEQAVSYLGFQSIRNLAMSVEIFSRWPGKACAGLDLEKLQQHVHAVAAAANALASKTPISDDTLLAGLLHDIGYWVLAQECPQDLTRAVEVATAKEIPLHTAEYQVMGASHAEIGAYLLGIWGLPYPVVEAVAHHHQPERVSQTEFDVLSALVIGHSLVAADDASVFSAAVPPDSKIDSRYLLAVKTPFDWEEAVRRVADTTGSEEVAA
jgi:putative nucleotidyltransferase with HDIG domain